MGGELFELLLLLLEDDADEDDEEDEREYRGTIGRSVNPIAQSHLASIFLAKQRLFFAITATRAQQAPTTKVNCSGVKVITTMFLLIACSYSNVAGCRQESLQNQLCMVLLHVR